MPGVVCTLVAVYAAVVMLTLGGDVLLQDTVGQPQEASTVHAHSQARTQLCMMSGTLVESFFFRTINVRPAPPIRG
jgi:hypothetical protein